MLINRIQLDNEKQFNSLYSHLLCCFLCDLAFSSFLDNADGLIHLYHTSTYIHARLQKVIQFKSIWTMDKCILILINIVKKKVTTFFSVKIDELLQWFLSIKTIIKTWTNEQHIVVFGVLCTRVWARVIYRWVIKIASNGYYLLFLMDTASTNEVKISGGRERLRHGESEGERKIVLCLRTQPTYFFYD